MTLWTWCAKTVTGTTLFTVAIVVGLAAGHAVQNKPHDAGGMFVLSDADTPIRADAASW